MVGTSADGVLLAMLVRYEIDEMEEDGEWPEWVLCGGGGVEIINMSVLRSGSKGELDGEGEGEGVWWTIQQRECQSINEPLLIIDGPAPGATPRGHTLQYAPAPLTQRTMSSQS